MPSGGSCEASQLHSRRAMVRAGVPLPDNDGTYEAHPLANEDIWPLSRARRPE